MMLWNVALLILAGEAFRVFPVVKLFCMVLAKLPNKHGKDASV